MSDFDIVIVGGGMVGSALACALGNSSLQVALLEGARPERIHTYDDIDLRVSAISHASQRIFAALDVWDAISAVRVSPFRDMRVWDASGTGKIHFDSSTIGQSTLGWIIENRVIQHALLAQTQTFDNIALFCPAALYQATLAKDAVNLQLEDGRKLRTRLLIGADGADSKVRRLSGIASGGWNYAQKGVVSTVATEYHHEETAWQRFLPTGPLAFLPLHDGRCSIVWSTTPDQADHLLNQGATAFAHSLAEAFAWRLGAITRVGPRGAFPLHTQFAQNYVKPRIALIGDAAHVVHPLAGQGVNLGLLDAASLAEVLLAGATAGFDPGSYKVLRRYERWRKGENILMLGVLDGLKRLFGNSLPPVRLLRNAGLNLTDRATPLKQLLARRAMGLDGDLPQLARNPHSAPLP